MMESALLKRIIGLVKNKKDAKAKIDQLYANGDKIGNFLYNLNPVALADAVDMFYNHNTMVLEMTKARYAKQFTKEIKIYDEYYNQILMMSDAIYNAIL